MNDLEKDLILNDYFIYNDVKYKRKWKVIKKFKKTMDGVYEVSNDGYVREIYTKKIRNQKIANKQIHPYCAVSLRQITGDLQWVLVHQLVARYWCKIPKHLKSRIEAGDINVVPDHIDNNGLNNVCFNLEWKTRSENNRDSKLREDYQHIEKSTIDPKDTKLIHEICRLLETDMGYKSILTELNIPTIYANYRCISAIKMKRIHTDISDCYNIRSSTRCTDKQYEIYRNLDLIYHMHKLGKGHVEIVNAIWPGLYKSLRKTRYKAVKRFLNGEIYKDYVPKELNLSEEEISIGSPS